MCHFSRYYALRLLTKSDTKLLVSDFCHLRYNICKNVQYSTFSEHNPADVFIPQKDTWTPF